VVDRVSGCDPRSSDGTIDRSSWVALDPSVAPVVDLHPGAFGDDAVSQLVVVFRVIVLNPEIIHSRFGDGPGRAVVKPGVPPPEATREARPRLPSHRSLRPGKTSRTRTRTHAWGPRLLFDRENEASRHYVATVVAHDGIPQRGCGRRRVSLWTGKPALCGEVVAIVRQHRHARDPDAASRHRCGRARRCRAGDRARGKAIAWPVVVRTILGSPKRWPGWKPPSQEKQSSALDTARR
jgi:hypothetical protein